MVGSRGVIPKEWKPWRVLTWATSWVIEVISADMAERGLVTKEKSNRCHTCSESY